MPLDPEKLKTLTGITADTDEEFAEQFNKKYLTEDQIFKDDQTRTRIFGKTIGSIKIGIKKDWDEDGISFTSQELESNTPEAIAKLGRLRLKERHNQELQEKEKTIGLSADEKIKEYQATVQKLTDKVKDYDQLIKQKADEFEGLTQTKNQELKNYKLNSVLKDVFDINWNPEKDEYSRTGFITKMKDKYQIDLEDDDNDFIVDKSTGQRIKAEGSHSTFMKPKDVIKMEAEKAGMAAINKKAGQPVIVQRTPQQVQQPTQTPVTGRKMASTRFTPGQ